MNVSARQLKATIEEIDELLVEAGRRGRPLEPWLRELAGELRAAVETSDGERLGRVLGRISAQPAASYHAHARLADLAARVLAGNSANIP